MGKRPRKAKESAPDHVFIPLTADGKRMSGLDLMRLNGPVPKWCDVWMLGQTSVPNVLPDWREQLDGPLAKVCRNSPPDGWPEAFLTLLNRYRLERFRELESANELDVVEAIEKIERAATKLKLFADFPKAEASVYQAAWERINAARFPHDQSGPLHDQLYPGLSLLISRLTALKAANAAEGTKQNSLQLLVVGCADLVQECGGKASGSNGIIKKGGSSGLSAFASLVRAAMLTVPLPMPCKDTPAAINKAVIEALKSGDNRT